MSITYVGDAHPRFWLTGEYEQDTLARIFTNVLDRYRHSRCLITNNTWLSMERLEKDVAGQQFDYWFYVGMIDPDYIVEGQEFQEMLVKLGNPELHLVGSFANTPHQFYVFAPMMLNEFRPYDVEVVTLESVKHKFINYNRKPHPHRQRLVDAILDEGLDQYGIVTIAHDTCPIVVEDKWEPFDDSGQNDNLPIPNDIMSLGNLEYWNNHFLNVVSETEANDSEHVFVSEKLFKPMIGMRPFIVNGNPKTYDWLTANGFKTFNQYFPEIEGKLSTLEGDIIKVLRWVCDRSDEELLSMYVSMYPDLMHNRERLFAFAKEQEQKIEKVCGWQTL